MADAIDAVCGQTLQQEIACRVEVSTDADASGKRFDTPFVFFFLSVSWSAATLASMVKQTALTGCFT